jgi:hypothetical protein
MLGPLVLVLAVLVLPRLEASTEARHADDNFQVQAETVACPSSFTVDHTGDAPDADPGDESCDDGSGNCTLRAALEESNALTTCSPININLTARGAINLGSSLPTITRPVSILGPGANLLTISGNQSFRLVNILLAAPGTVTINDLSFSGGGKGAGENATAIEFNNNGTLNLNRDEFFNNSGPSGSSLIFSNASAALNMTSCSLHHNTLEHVVVIGNTPFNITNSTISNNTGTGAAVFVFGGTPSATITSSTITNNNQGLWHANGAGASIVTIRNSIFSQNGGINLRRTGSATCAENGIVSVGYNLIDNNPGSSLCTSEATDLIGASFNPQLTPVAFLGGPTRTRALLGASAALDKGHRFGLTTDQRGQARPFDNPALPPATGGDNSDIGAFELQATCSTINVNPSTLPNWNTTSAYNQTLIATGGSVPYSFTIVEGSLPPGFTLSSSGALTSTATATGTFNFTILSTDAGGCYGQRSYTINISDCTTISLSPASLPNGVQGTAYSQLITASGGAAPYTFSFSGALPTGLSLSSSGTLSGTPTAAGVFNFTVAATSNIGCTGSRAYEVVIGDAVSAGEVIISEFRFRGPDADDEGPLTASANEFIEFYNTTNGDIVVSASGGSAGWALVASNGEVKFIIPSGTVIPAHGRFLAVNNAGYGLPGSATGDALLLPDGVTEAAGYSLDIADGAGVALFNNSTTFNTATRLDAVGFAGVADALYLEGPGLAPSDGVTSDGEIAFVRRFVGGIPADTNDNLADFLFLSTDGGIYNGSASRLGAPGPQNSASPINRNSSIALTLLDPLVAAGSAPNRVRNFSSDPANNATFGTLSIRRRVTNNTGSPLIALRFRIIDITSFPSPNAETADVRALTSTDASVMFSDAAVVEVLGTTVQSPPTQPYGGGLNATLSVPSVTTSPTTSTQRKTKPYQFDYAGEFTHARDTITLATPLAPGDSLNVQFILGIQKPGLFRFYLNIEALTESPASPSAPLTKRNPSTALSRRE